MNYAAPRSFIPLAVLFLPLPWAQTLLYSKMIPMFLRFLNIWNSVVNM